MSPRRLTLLATPQVVKAPASRAPRLLILGSIWPEPSSSAAGLRDMNLISSFQARGWRVHYSAEAKQNAFSAQLEKAGVETSVRPSNDSSFDRWIASDPPDVVIFDTFTTEERFGSRIAESAPLAVRVLDTQDLHFLRRSRQRDVAAIDQARASGIAGAEDTYCMALSAALRGSMPVATDDEGLLRELAAVFRSDLTLLISDHELRLLTAPPFSISPQQLLLARFQYPPPPLPAETATFEEREHFCMIGNFRHPPNMDAVLWLHAEIWPAIRSQLPNAKIHIFGAYPPREAMALTDPAVGFIVGGPVKEHLRMLGRHRVNLAPLRFGAGIKGKVADGWWAGTPCVTTPIGAEGMTGGLPFGGVIGSSVQDLVDGAVQLYTSQERWDAAQAAGRRLIKTIFSEEVNSADLVSRVLSHQAALSERRRENVVGSMLWMHMHRSTKYFSQWIEAKNANKAK